jgi:hypothetical protein
MENDEKAKPDDADGQQNRMALGIALGIPFGVVLSLLLDNWGMVGVGVALGVSFGLLPGSKGSTADSSDATGADPGVGEERLDPGDHR